MGAALTCTWLTTPAQPHTNERRPTEVQAVTVELKPPRRCVSCSVCRVMARAAQSHTSERRKKIKPALASAVGDRCCCLFHGASQKRRRDVEQKARKNVTLNAENTKQFSKRITVMLKLSLNYLEVTATRPCKRQTVAANGS